MLKDEVRGYKKSEKGDIAPYLLGWILGVPGSILLLIFVLRGCR